MFGLFKKKEEKFVVVAPVTGELIPLTEVPDQVFSQKIMGDGLAVVPKEGLVVAPISGVAESVFPTGHAVGIKTGDGIECIVHIGVDTVELKGEGFTPLIRQGDKVKAGSPMIRFDKALLESKGYNPVTMVLFPSERDRKFEFDCREVTQGEQLM